MCLLTWNISRGIQLGLNITKQLPQLIESVLSRYHRIFSWQRICRLTVFRKYPEVIMQEEESLDEEKLTALVTEARKMQERSFRRVVASRAAVV